MDHRNFFYKLIYERHSSPCQPVSLYNAAKSKCHEDQLQYGSISKWHLYFTFTSR